MLPYQKRLWYTLNMIPRGADGGYTILETMIFLAVTAMLFIAAMTTIGGKQATVQFTQGIRDTQSKIQDVINNVSTGYFPTDSNFKCIVGDAIPANNIPNVAPSFTLGASIQGSSEKCVSLGKVLEFANSATASEGPPTLNGFLARSRWKSSVLACPFCSNCLRSKDHSHFKCIRIWSRRRLVLRTRIGGE